MNSNNKSFSFSYSGATNDELEHIKEKYSNRQTNEKMKRIRTLDKRVDFISTMISIILGIVGSVLLVTGIVRMIKALPFLPLNITISTLGMLVSTAVPFLHSKIYNSIKSLYAPEILALIKDIEQNRL